MHMFFMYTYIPTWIKYVRDGVTTSNMCSFPGILLGGKQKRDGGKEVNSSYQRGYCRLTLYWVNN